jgi:hypothetical protein
MNTRIRRTLVLLALGGTALQFLGGTFGPNFGCTNYATNADYLQMYQQSGNDVLQTVSDRFWDVPTLHTDNNGNLVFDTAVETDWDRWIRQPITNFTQNMFGNWLDARIPDDLPNNAIVER